MTLYVNTSGDKLPPFRLKHARPTDDDSKPFVNKWGRSKPRWQWFVGSDESGPVIDPEPFLDEIESEGGFGDSSLGIEGQSGREMTNRYYMCPSHNDEYERDIRNGAYGYNYQYLGNSRQDADDGRWDNFPVGIQRLRTAGQTVLIADSRGAGRRHGKHSYTLDPPRLAVENYADRFGPGGGDVEPGIEDTELYQYSPVAMRHGKRGNVSFLDGHAEAMTLEDLGYQLNEDRVPMPILDATTGSYTASNKLWNGEGYDHIAVKARRR